MVRRPCRAHAFEQSSSLAPPITWTNIAAGATGTNGTWQFLDPITPGARRRFYRARELP
jgi:hypothetical protein